MDSSGGGTSAVAKVPSVYSGIYCTWNWRRTFSIGGGLPTNAAYDPLPDFPCISECKTPVLPNAYRSLPPDDCSVARIARPARETMRTIVAGLNHWDTGFEVWHILQTSFWPVVNRHRGGGTIGVASNVGCDPRGPFVDRRDVRPGTRFF
jgi:hypothetical protein